ncbi:imelysin family protein [Marinobacter fonticola]|uniref:imelysin family protein n=1 Tax=Marinobacter fonticola TaxID=2603215 RepID=UPI0011E83485|nr:imelysin family protein [Marinobacter fonticola]
MAGKARASIVYGLGIALLLAGCSEPPPPGEAPVVSEAEPATIPPALKTAVTEQTQAVCESVSTLHDRINQFLDAPSAQTLTSARETWRGAHQTYQQLATLYRIADLSLPHQFNDRDPVDAHPMLPGYLDQVPHYPRSGLTFSEVPLTPDFLRKEHQSTDFFYLTLGFHPLESLLWPKGHRPIEATLANFRTPGATPETGKINAPERRQDLLRLIATALQRDIQPLCQPQNQAHLIAGLARLHQAPPKAAVRLERTLANTVGTALAAWAKNPEGEDRNGMPVGHSPQARTDFSEYSAVVNALKATWIPILLAEKEEAREKASEALATLATKLDAIDPQQKPIDTAALAEARVALTQFSEGLTELAFEGQAAQY